MTETPGAGVGAVAVAGVVLGGAGWGDSTAGGICCCGAGAVTATTAGAFWARDKQDVTCGSQQGHGEQEGSARGAAVTSRVPSAADATPQKGVCECVCV